MVQRTIRRNAGRKYYLEDGQNKSYSPVRVVPSHSQNRRKIYPSPYVVERGLNWYLGKTEDLFGYKSGLKLNRK